MQDSFQRRITYLRVSLTDRCNLRCRYCMSETPPFLPKSDLLSLEEMERVCLAFIQRGVKKIRLTGGEPLLRHQFMILVEKLGQRLNNGGLDELTMTTNGIRLAELAQPLADAGIKRLNISLDSLKPERFDHITRRINKLPAVLAGIKAAHQAGLRVKINTVALKGFNDDEYDSLLRWCGERGFDLTLIEAMPLNGEGGTYGGTILPLSEIESQLSKNWSLSPIVSHNHSGPARMMHIKETGTKIGFITPMSQHFCATCNRVRLSCTGELFPCLGDDKSYDLRSPLREDPTDYGLNQAINQALKNKPEAHQFHNYPTDATRGMNLTGG